MGSAGDREFLFFPGVLRDLENDVKKGKSRDTRHPSTHKMKLFKDMTVFQIFIFYFF